MTAAGILSRCATLRRELATRYSPAAENAVDAAEALLSGEKVPDDELTKLSRACNYGGLVEEIGMWLINAACHVGTYEAEWTLMQADVCFEKLAAENELSTRAPQGVAA